MTAWPSSATRGARGRCRGALETGHPVPANSSATERCRSGSIIRLANAFDGLTGGSTDPTTITGHRTDPARSATSTTRPIDDLIAIVHGPEDWRAGADHPRMRCGSSRTRTSCDHSGSALLGLLVDLGDLVNLGEQLVSLGDVEVALGPGGTGDLVASLNRSVQVRVLRSGPASRSTAPTGGLTSSERCP